MLASKTFVKKTKKGAVVKVVREHYLRDDVWCGVKGCGVCKQQDPPLEGCPVVNSDLCPGPHYLLPDTNVVLHQIDFLEDPSITNIIILQVVLQEVCGQVGEAEVGIDKIVSCYSKMTVYSICVFSFVCRQSTGTLECISDFGTSSVTPLSISTSLQMSTIEKLS